MSVCTGCKNLATTICEHCDGLYRYETGVVPDISVALRKAYAKYLIYNSNSIQDACLEHRMAIKKVIFNNPATIVLWQDGTKTIVKCGENESFDPEKGLAMAVSKRALGDKGSYYEVFKKWLTKESDAGRVDISDELNEKISGIKLFGVSNGFFAKLNDIAQRIDKEIDNKGGNANV